MTRYVTGIRGRVTFAVLALTAVLYSVLGTIGFLQIAHSGRAATSQRIDQVLNQLEADRQVGTSTVQISTPDGVVALVEPSGPLTEVPAGEIGVRRTVTIDGARVVLFGTAPLAPLAESLRSLYRVVWIAVPLAAVLSALMAGFATAHALRPVAEVTALARSIGTAGAVARVPVPASGDEIEQLARTLNSMLDRIGDSTAMQRRFTSDAAHELRTPLMALQCEIELASQGALNPTLLDRLAVQVDRLGARVDELVLLATLDESPPLELRAAQLSEIVQTEASTLSIPVTIVGDSPDVLVDRHLIGRAARNLLVNARRHAATRVEVTITSVGDGRVRLDIDDDGPGIAPVDRGRVLERFGRLDEARHADTGGAGLGLSIAASIAHVHGGDIEVADSPLGGARITVWVPSVDHQPLSGDRRS